MSPGALPSWFLVFQLVCHFRRYWAYSSQSTVWPRMESCFQDGACSVSSFISTVCQQIEKQVVGTRKNDFIQKASRPERWWAQAPKNHLSWVRIQAVFILEGKGVKSTISWFQSDSEGMCSFLPSCSHSPMGLVGDVSCELNKGILV